MVNRRRRKNFSIDIDSMDFKASKFVKITTVVLLIALLITVGSYAGVYAYISAPVDITSEETTIFVVNKGETVNGVLERLEKEGFIKSAFWSKVYLKTTSIDQFYAGEYKLSKSYDFNTILTILSGIGNAKGEVVTVQFIEGKRLTDYAQVISENFGYSKEEVISQLNNKEYLQRVVNTYWFVGDEILNDNLYYPLEGYLYPDKYEFNKNASVRDISNTMLRKMGEVLEPFKDKIKTSSYGVHGLLTLASMVELEAVSAEDRALTAGVFYNRIAKGWSLGSDVTTYYDAKLPMIPGTLGQSELNGCHGYNTRSASCVRGLPIGPIASVSLSSIKAAIEPTETNYMYFVADSEGKLYFAETEYGHNRNINDLRNKGKWLE